MSALDDLIAEVRATDPETFARAAGCDDRTLASEGPAIVAKHAVLALEAMRQDLADGGLTEVIQPGRVFIDGEEVGVTLPAPSAWCDGP